ncbi:tryptophan--tRNA ligase [Pseudodesulfovibrio sp. zrk46]|uniref:tryptophan--tRNA ligase n=1 Tax=Pseudodesulfovibrio sp. zrk46 TaxID=2725288 RepID=UPI00144A210D|nr:tryptophan--tRNA ligase [Pseudodesulfovibrio sp. zrk46]QJB55085.1 tryptophan--tRNA ligase [Pseudodesulfovibrio sp. zrk46]
MSDNNRILSGMRPTGPLHLGHYFGVIANWLKLQEEYNCFFFVADWHALTSEYADPTKIKGFVPGLVKDWVASGLDPEKCTIFQQSMVKEHAELHLLFSMTTPLGWLERCPTYKEQKTQLAEKKLNTYGFLGYPVLQAADILLYKPCAVPVGKDQLPHLELTREIGRRFNHLNKTELFPEPADMLTEECKLPGLDGRKMSKSYGNSIQLSEPIEEIMPKLRSMKTDESRLRKSDPGDPAVCNLYPYHKLMTDPAKLPEIQEGCKNATWGCVDCKKVLMESMEAFLTPFHERRNACTDERVAEILDAGNKKAREFAIKTMDEVRGVLNFDF